MSSTDIFHYGQTFWDHPHPQQYRSKSRYGSSGTYQPIGISIGQYFKPWCWDNLMNSLEILNLLFVLFIHSMIIILALYMHIAHAHLHAHAKLACTFRHGQKVHGCLTSHAHKIIYHWQTLTWIVQQQTHIDIISLTDYNMDQSRTSFCKMNIIAGVKVNTLSSSSRWRIFSLALFSSSFSAFLKATMLDPNKNEDAPFSKKYGN